jgi:hypothetical protein
VAGLLDDPYGAERMGEGARLRVRGLFLGPRHLGQDVDTLEGVLAPYARRERRAAAAWAAATRAIGTRKGEQLT